MSVHHLRRVLASVAIGVGWRLAVFTAVALCFHALVELKTWHSTYAPSKAWAAAVLKERLEWSSVVSAAAGRMPEESYPTAASFYRALHRYINKQLPLNSTDEALATEYQSLLENRRKIRSKVAPRDDKFADRSLALSMINDRISDVATEIDNIEAQETTRDKEKALKAEEKKLGHLIALKAALFAGMRDERSAIELGFQKPLADLDARIKTTEEEIRAAFDAAVSSARPLGGPVVRLLPRRYAIRIGDEADPLHILYVITWYGLEGLIALLLCIVIVPWLINLGTDKSDPDTLRSTITTRIKGWLTEAFGPRAAAATGRVVATAAVASLALAGVAAAAGEQPAVAPAIQHEDAAGPDGAGKQLRHDQKDADEDENEQCNQEDCEKNTDGPSSKDGATGPAGPRGENVIPPELLERLETQEDDLERQASMIAILQKELATVSEKAVIREAEIRSLQVATTALFINFDRLAVDMGSFTSNLSSLNDLFFGLAISKRAMTDTLDGMNQRIFFQLNHLNDTTRRTDQNVQTISSTINRAAANIQPLAGDLLMVDAIPNGAMTRVNPRHRYSVTGEVIELVSRAMGEKPNPEEQQILDALRAMGSKPERMKLRQFRTRLQDLTKANGQDRLKQWMPLIVKVSRVQD